MRSEVIDIIKSLLLEQLFVEIPPDQMGLDDSLQTVMSLDSVSFVELRMLCERTFKIDISDAEFSPENFRTINCITDLILHKRSKEDISHVV
jgi:acyl carrier protein